MEGRDYQIFDSPDLGNQAGRGGDRRSINYLLSISTAKEIAMAENSKQGRNIRQYLIKVEEAWNTPDMVIMRGYQALQRKLENQQKWIDLTQAENDKLSEQSKSLSAKNALLTGHIKRTRHKIEIYDLMMDSDVGFSMATVAEILNILKVGRNKIFRILRESGILHEDNTPKQQYIESGFFEVRDVSINGTVFKMTLTTFKGIDFVRKTALNYQETARFV